MIVKVVDDCALCFGGTFEPAYAASIYSIGKISPELNVTTSAAISQYLSKELGLPDDRGYIMFSDVKGSNFGYKGKTF
jgi:phenylpyruvate tautomerase